MSDEQSTTARQVEYREIPGYPGYEVGSDGTVWSNFWRGPRNGFRELKGGVDKDGYRKLILCKNKARKHIRVHILILEIFRGPKPDGFVGAHNNGNKTDNRIGNLRWDTQFNNIQDKREHGTHQVGETATNRILTTEQVIEIKRRLARGETAKQMAEGYGVRPITISQIKAGRNWSHVVVPNISETTEPPGDA